MYRGHGQAFSYSGLIVFCLFLVIFLVPRIELGAWQMSQRHSAKTILSRIILWFRYSSAILSPTYYSKALASEPDSFSGRFCSRSPCRADWVTEPISQGPLEVAQAARTVGQNLQVGKEARLSEQGRKSSLTGL